MAEVVSEFRSSRVHELAALIDGCADESLDISAEAGNIISRMRELYFFAPDLAGMVQHLKDVALHNNLLYWAKFGQERGLDELPWGRVNQAAEQMLTEPPLYQRDWSHGAIQPQYAEAITGWLDLRECARRALQRSARAERIDELELVVGSTTVFKFGASEKFKILQSPAVDLLDKIFDTILARPDLDLDMFPAALTYFGADGLMVLNRLAIETEDLISALVRFADDGVFDAEAVFQLLSRQASRR